MPNSLESVYAKFPLVKEVLAVTFGPAQGHEAFTNKQFLGREKIDLYYDDITSVDLHFDYDTILFDGGESRPKYPVEVDKFKRLLREGVLRWFHKGVKNFCVKILTPEDPDILSMLKEIQLTTGKGIFVSQLDKYERVLLHFG